MFFKNTHLCKTVKVMKFTKRLLSLTIGIAVAASCLVSYAPSADSSQSTAPEWGTLEISGGGFVSGIVTGETAMYCRTDVGGAYRYDNGEWVQMMAFLSEEDRGFMCVEAMCLDPNDEDTIYLLCGCNYFSDARTAIFKSTDGGNSFTEYDVSDYIRVHGNGAGRQMGERIAVDPNNSDVIYCGGRTGGLIKSTDGGKNWEMIFVPAAFSSTVKWPEWTDFMVTTTSDQNGITTVYVDENSKVYVGVSTTGSTNLYASSDGGASFSALSSELPTSMYIARINPDCNGNLLLSYQGGISFAGSGGGAYRYNITTGEVENISPSGNSIGQIQSHPDNADYLVATTCGVWSTQMWADSDNAVWGEWIYTSLDGGATWETIYPGKKGNWYWNAEAGEMQQESLYQCLQDGGVSWVHGKAIHWSGSLVFDPNNSDDVLVTSGNGVFKWSDILTSDPVATFHAKGIEEVVALDFCSVEGGYNYSAIGDYDGFTHKDVDTAVQHSPNFGSSTSISYCYSNPDIMMRVAEYGSQSTNGQYSTDGGASWTEFASSPGVGGDTAIVQLENGTYRFIAGSSQGSALKYSDDYGATWNSASGLKGSKKSMLEVDSADERYVYGFSSVTSYSGETTYYYLNVSSDYGATFSAKEVAVNDCCADFRRITVVNGTVFCPVGWYGLYSTSDHGESFTKLDSVAYCETIGCGAAKDASSPNTLYMWGWLDNDNVVEGIYASTDLGQTWQRVNDDAHQYGGPGNGNFVVGDMNEFGTFYVSSVGLGIIYCKNAFGTATEQPKEILYGDVNGDGVVNSIDATLITRYTLKLYTISDDNFEAADVNCDGVVNSVDATIITRYVLKIISSLPI